MMRERDAMAAGPAGLRDILERLEALAAYEGPWQPIRKQAPLLRERVQELRLRETRLDDLLVVAMVGGSGAGKSTLLNALAGDELAATSAMRPCTHTPTVYLPPGAGELFPGWEHASKSALERLAIVDTPDSDTIVREHREVVIEALRLCDLILVCGSPEKYLDDATWSLLRPLRHERQIVCIETKASAATQPIREHWVRRLEEEGFSIDAYFRVNALRALDRKLTGEGAPEEEFEFARLEAFLREELSRERIRRIKRSNAAGLLRKTLGDLVERIEGQDDPLRGLEEAAARKEQELLEAVCGLVGRDLFAEPHLWAHALGREMAARAKGLVGLCFRLVEALRSLPARLGAVVPWLGGRGLGRRAALLLSSGSAGDEPGFFIGDEAARIYQSKRSELRLGLARAGFEIEGMPDGWEAFRSAAGARIAAVLAGPAHARLAKQARHLTAWPVTLIVEAAPVAFLGFFAYRVVRAFFSTQLLTGVFFIHAAAVLAILLGVEIALLSLIGRGLAWSLRRQALRDLRAAFVEGNAAFSRERAALQGARAAAQEVMRIAETVGLPPAPAKEARHGC